MPQPHCYPPVDEEPKISEHVIIDSSDLEWRQMSTKEHQSFVFKFGGYTTTTIPHDFHYGAFINECIKQVTHCSNWFNRDKPKPAQKLPLVRKWRSLSLVFDFESGCLSFLENPVKHSFVAKNDVVETTAEREVVKLKPLIANSLMKQIKASGIYKKQMSFEVEKFVIQWQKPACF